MKNIALYGSKTRDYTITWDGKSVAQLLGISEESAAEINQRALSPIGGIDLSDYIVHGVARYGLHRYECPCRHLFTDILDAIKCKKCFDL